jgi:hypothetical protein
MPYADIVAVIIAFIFAYLYTQEKQFVLKYVFLFISLMIMIFASTQNYALTQEFVNYNYTKISSVYLTQNTLTTYTYTATNYNVPLVYGLGMFLITLVAYFVYMFIKSAKRMI